MPEPKMEMPTRKDLIVLSNLLTCKDLAETGVARAGLRTLAQTIKNGDRDGVLRVIDEVINSIEKGGQTMEGEEQKGMWLLAHGLSGDAKFVAGMKKLKTLIETTDPALIDFKNIANLSRDNHIGE